MATAEARPWTLVSVHLPKTAGTSFAEALQRAQQSGVQVLAYDCDVTPDGLSLGKQIPCCF